MTPKHTSRADSTPLRVVMLTMDTHLASGAARVQKSLARELPGLTLTLHAASEWCASARALESVLADIASADFIVATMLFLEDHYLPIIGALRARRGRCDALMCAMSAGEVVSLTQVGGFDMASKDAGLLSMLRRLRGQRGKKPGESSGAQQMRMLRRLPKLLRFIPGTAQDVRAYFLCLQYWLGGSADNLANLVRLLVNRYADGPRRALRGQLRPQPPIDYPDVGLYHPGMAQRVCRQLEKLPRASGAARGTVGLLVLRS